MKIASGDVMTRVPAREAEERESLGTRLTVRLSRLSLAIYSGKVPGFTYSSLTLTLTLTLTLKPAVYFSF